MGTARGDGRRSVPHPRAPKSSGHGGSRCLRPASQPLLPADLRGEGAAGEPERGGVRAAHLRGVPGAAQQAAPPLPLLAAAQVSPQTLHPGGGSPCPLGVTEGPWPRGSFPSRFIIGRSRGEAVAERRKEELNGYIWHLIHAAPEVAEVRGWGTPGGGDGGAGERNLGGKGANAVRKASVCAPWVLGDVVTGTGPSLPRSATSSTPFSTHCRGMRRQLAPALHQNQQVGGLGCTPHPPRVLPVSPPHPSRVPSPLQTPRGLVPWGRWAAR